MSVTESNWKPLFRIGGVAPLLTLAWVGATRINKPLTWWRKVLPENIRRVLAKIWPASLFFGLICFLIALEIAIFGIVPGINDADQKLYICWSLLGVGLVAFLFTFMAGFAHDIQKQNRTVG